MNRFFFLFSLLIALLIGACTTTNELAPDTNDFFHVHTAEAYLPVWVRGNTSSNKILLYIAGGPGGSAIDFAHVDFPGWKQSLEQDIAIAYYDQRGTGNNQGTFDLASVNLDQYAADIHEILSVLKQRHEQTEIYLFGHSFGGYLAYHYLSTYGEEALSDGCISFNGPATTDADPERWEFRWAYLNQLAVEKIEQKEDTLFWQRALAWTEDNPKIESDTQKREWNQYVERAVIETDRPISVSEALGVLFFSPYNYFSAYAYGKLEKVEENIFTDGKGNRLIDDLYLIRQQILLITGRYDDIAPPEEMQYVLESVSSKEKELVVIQDAGHDPYIDQPEIFVDVVLNFVKD